MKVFRELFINLKEIDKDSFSERLKTNLPEFWERQLDKEQESFNWAMSFWHKEENNLPEASLWIMQKGDQSELLYVTNIVPKKKSSLSIDEYNALLKNFYETVLKNYEKEHLISVKITKDIIIAEEYFSEETFSKFKLFCLLANKGTQASHPLDKKRWYDFIITSYIKNEVINVDYLIGFLKDFGWQGDDAFDLALQYEFAIGLLKEYNNYVK